MTSLLLLFGALPLAAAEPHWLDQAIGAFTGLFPDDSFFSIGFNVRALLALVLVSLTCGSVGSLVVGSRMAFFSDALAHCAFAGVSIGFLLHEWGLRGAGSSPEQFWQWVSPVMVGFGVLVGFGIVWVRGRTGLASDTVIGVFFASAIGLAAMLRKIISSRHLFSLEDFLFGDPLLVQAPDLVQLVFMTGLTLALLAWLFNGLLLSSFNTSLALSRRVPVRLANYLFVMLLAFIVNLSLRCVGVLLINALLVVPAATAVNLGRNMRQVFWLTVGLCLGEALLGQAISWEVETRFPAIKLGIPGTIILLGALVFAVSMAVGPWWRARPEALAPSSPCKEPAAG